jgi:3-methylcrotonyl-CoA carboxylase alpha subunit
LNSTIRKILIANRGEIANRIIRTAKKLNIQTVAIFSDVDKNQPFVKNADESYPLNGNEASITYLNIEKIIQIAKASKADAIHPGYGFLSENSEFAKKVQDAGILFIGPDPISISLMGDKVESRKKMMELGIPVIPGYDGGNQDSDFLKNKAKEIGYPIMIKATAGGGGRGMRKVLEEQEFISNLESAKREALSFFKNDQVFLEKLIIEPRHIEVQIIGDCFGNVLHLFDRDCSVQRKNQKVIEEAPAPNIDLLVRNNILDTAVKAAKFIGYKNAGTVEFVLDSTNHFYFLEMNTRLQVEHPVTEMITGIDLVELQIQIASGKQLPYSQNEIKTQGHSIELRICAEQGGMNPSPGTGKIHFYSFLENTHSRLDSGVELNSSVSIFYDSMIAKLINYGSTRQEAIERSLESLNHLVILGIPLNKEMLFQILKDNSFQNGIVDTSFLSKYYLDFDSSKILNEGLLYAFLIDNFKILTEKYFFESTDSTRKLIKFNDKVYICKIDKNQHISICNDTNELIGSFQLPLIESIEKNCFILKQNKVFFVRYGNKIFIQWKENNIQLEFVSESFQITQKNKNSLSSPMPGKIISLSVKIGDLVHEGDTLMIVEAMKMENKILSPGKFRVKEIYFSLGDLVKPEDELIKLDID